MSIITFVVLAVLGGILLSNSLSDFGPCGMSDGPVYGAPVDLKLETLTIEQYIDLPDGNFGLANLSDSLPIKLIKFDAAGKELWAVEFSGDSSTVSIPHFKLSEMTLKQNKYGVKLEFFNYDHYEPGRIYLTEDFEVKYMCLSMM